MKIYTFNAGTDTKVECLWSLRPNNRDRAFDKFISEFQCIEVTSIQDCDLAIFPRKAFNPESLALDNSVLDAVQEAARYSKSLVIDATCDSDSPLEIPKAAILRFGLYRSLKQDYETERPYWTKHETKEQLESLPILPRSSKPAVGFCGTTASAGKYFKIGKMLPTEISKTILSQGSWTRKVDVRLQKGMSHKLREVVIKRLTADQRIDAQFELTNSFKDYYDPVNPDRLLLEKLFVENMGKCDYALCVRANGNYSGRFYMALNAGRIPLIVDTDRVFPFETQIHMVKVPVNCLDNISDFVCEHFEKTTEKEFMEMKMENRAVYNKLMAPDKYIPNFLATVNHS
jgi:hypothetical protein